MIDRLLAKHRSVGIDSNVLIYLFEGNGAEADLAGMLLDAIAVGDTTGVLASLAIAEVGTGPARAGDAAMVERYADELSSLENVRLMPLDRDVAVEAANLRASGTLSLADAIHLASAKVAGATAFVTNDRRITAVPGLEIAYLDRLVAA